MKQKLRKKFFLERKKISARRKKEAAISAYDKLINLTKGYNSILSYSPIDNEVSLTKFNLYLQSQGRLSLPKIEEEALVPYAASDMENQLKTFSHKFLEPDNSCKKAEHIDLALVPGILFDKDGGRIGFGKGHYDKFLEKRKIKTIGILFKEQLYEGLLPLESHDIAMEGLCIV